MKGNKMDEFNAYDEIMDVEWDSSWGEMPDDADLWD
jgi:hypothetical protein